MNCIQKELIEALFSNNQFNFLRLPRTFDRQNQVEHALRSYIINRLQFENNYSILIYDPFDLVEKDISAREQFIVDNFSEALGPYSTRRNFGNELMDGGHDYFFTEKGNKCCIGAAHIRTVYNEIIFFNFQEFFINNYLKDIKSFDFIGFINSCETNILGIDSTPTNQEIEQLGHIFADYRVPVSLKKIAKIFHYNYFDEDVTRNRRLARELEQQQETQATQALQRKKEAEAMMQQVMLPPSLNDALNWEYQQATSIPTLSVLKPRDYFDTSAIKKHDPYNKEKKMMFNFDYIRGLDD